MAANNTSSTPIPAAEVAAGTYGPLPGAPLWAQQMQQTMQTGFNKQEARSNNLEARLFNRDIREGHITLHPLYKVRAGHGKAFPAPPGTRVPDLGPVAAVGTMYPGFPVNFYAVGDMTHAEIAFLAQWANETFGIQAGDSLTVRRNKFRFFVCFIS